MKVRRTVPGRYVVEAVAKALDILEAFDHSQNLSLLEISRRASLNKSRTFRLLCTLTEHGYIEHTEGRHYKLGLKVLERAGHVGRDLKQLARPAMAKIQARFNETVNLGVLDDTGHVLYLDIVESSRPFRMTATVGCRMPATHTALGKAMLSCLRTDDLKSPGYLIAARLSPGSARALGRELGVIHERGYAIDNQENESGIACIGAPIVNASGWPVAAISVSGPLHRILRNETLIAPAVIAACRTISARLGHDSFAPDPVAAVPCGGSTGMTHADERGYRAGDNNRALPIRPDAGRYRAPANEFDVVHKGNVEKRAASKPACRPRT